MEKPQANPQVRKAATYGQMGCLTDEPPHGARARHQTRQGISNEIQSEQSEEERMLDRMSHKGGWV